MTRTITLTNVVVYKWQVDLAKQNVQVWYDIVDDQGAVWITGDAIFWETIPEQLDPDGNPVSPPNNWYQLPQEHSSVLVALTQDAKTALTAALL